jgi:hypothetical protein
VGRVTGFPSAWIACIAAASAATPIAHAQDPSDVTRGQTVMERPRPELDALGIHLGGFQLFPALGLSETYRDNIFATESGKQSDAITEFLPAVRLQSNWSRHSLTLFSDARIGRYIDHPKEDYEDYTVGGRGRLDIVGRSYATAQGSYNQRHEDRSSPDDVRGVEPTQFTDTNFGVGGTMAFNRLILGIDGIFDRYIFENALNAAGVTINNQDRNRDQSRVLIRAGYELAPLRTVFVRAGYDRRSYETERDDNGFARSSDGYEIEVGADYDLTGVTFLEGYIGYRHQSYDDSRLSDASGVGAGLKVIWNVTRLTTVTGGVEREVEETTQLGASSYFATRFTARVDHELLRNLVIHANALYGSDDYEGISRNDDHFGAGVGAIYQLNRNFGLSGNYAFRARSSNVPSADFDENIVTLRLTARY